MSVSSPPKVPRSLHARKTVSTVARETETSIISGEETHHFAVGRIANALGKLQKQGPRNQHSCRHRRGAGRVQRGARAGVSTRLLVQSHGLGRLEWRRTVF